MSSAVIARQEVSAKQNIVLLSLNSVASPGLKGNSDSRRLFKLGISIAALVWYSLLNRGLYSCDYMQISRLFSKSEAEDVVSVSLLARYVLGNM
jgi:hypothetical protein